MSSLKEKANNILSDKSTNLLPENIKKDTTILGVVGTLETLDTSDANATPSDLSRDKTAYVNGEKITGTITTFSSILSYTFYPGQCTVSTDEIMKRLDTHSQFNNDILIRSGVKVNMQIPYEDITTEIGLTADKLKAGEEILGVTGTLETLNTSDATATADDIARNKTAYVNGELITGNVFSYDDEILNSDTMEIDLNQLSGDGDLPGMIITLKQSVSSKCMVTNNTKISAFKRYDEFTDLIGLTPEKIKAGETILGVTGTYTGE